MGLYKRSNSNAWQMLFRDEHGRTIRRSAGSADKTVAEMRLAAELKAVERRSLGIQAPSPLEAGRDISVHIERFLFEAREQGLSTDYIKNQRWQLEKMRKALRWQRITDITTAQLRRYLSVQLADKSHKTKKTYVEAVRLLCKWGMQQSPPLLGTNPAIGVMPRLRGKAGRIEQQTVYKRRPLWADEIAKLINSKPVASHQMYRWTHERLPIYVVALRTGYRRGTLNQLRTEHVKLTGAQPHIAVPPEMTKSGRGITTTLSDPLVIEMVERRLSLCTRRGPSNPAYGHPFRPVPRVELLRQDLTSAGVDVHVDGRIVDFHSLRYSFCVQLALAGVTLLVARDLMDHVNIQTTTKIYQMAGVTQTAEGIRALPSLDGQPPAALKLGG